MKKYELLFIDLDETLFDFARAEREALTASLAAFNVPLSAAIAERYETVNRALWRRLERGEIELEFLKTERFRLLFEALHLAIDARDFSAVFIRQLSAGSFPLDQAEEVCAYLSGRYRLVVISNGIGEVQHARIRNSGLRDLIQALIVSEEAGFSKPDPRIFEYACERVGFHDKAAMIMIGDSLSSDIQGGVNFGIDTCWTNLKALGNESGLVPTYEVSTLAELKRLF